MNIHIAFNTEKVYNIRDVFKEVPCYMSYVWCYCLNDADTMRDACH